MASEIPTPLTDALFDAVNNPRDHASGAALLDMRDLARRLERLLAEMAEALEVSTKWYAYKGDCPTKLDLALTWKENDAMAEAKMSEALRHYAELKYAELKKGETK